MDKVVLKRYSRNLSLGLLLILLTIWTYSWIHREPYNWHSRCADVKVGAAMLTENKFIVSRENIGYGYPLFILLAQKLFGDETSGPQTYDAIYVAALEQWKTPTSILLYIIYLCSFILSWLVIRKSTDMQTANSVVAVLILFLLSNPATSLPLQSEPLYFSLVLIIFSLVVSSFNSQRNVVFFVLGLVVYYASEVRPFPLYGVAVPLFFYLLWKYWREREMVDLYNLGVFISGIITCKLILFLIIGYAFNFDLPQKSNAYNETLRVLHMDGICWRSNGSACEKLLDIDKTIAPERHKEGWIDQNKGTYRYVFENYGIEEMERLYYQAAEESIVAYPFITLRNTALNILSFISHEHLLYLQARRETTLSYWPMNPEEWSNPAKILISTVISNLRYPFWIILFIILVSKKLRSNIDPSLIILLCFCTVHILIPSIAGRYVPRFSHPMYVAAFIPFSIILWRRCFYYIWYIGAVSLITIMIKLLFVIWRA